MIAQVVAPRWETPDPPGATGSYGDAAIAWARRRLGIVAGPWQAYVLRKLLRHDATGALIHRVALISTARQNGKSIIVRIVIGWMLDEGRDLPAFADWSLMLAAAHDVPQARIIYEAVYADMLTIPEMVEATRGDRLSRQVKLTDQRGIRVGGLSFNTVTSQPGSVRGKSAGLIAWDEMLTQRDWDMWRALAPAQSAQRSPLMVLTSTAGDPDSVVLRSFYDKLKRQSTGDDQPDPSFYGVWWQSEDPNAGLDWDAIEQANPALGDGRLSRDFIAGEYGGPADLWRQERLNHWLDTTSASAYGAGQWSACRAETPLAESDGPFCLGVSVGPDWQRATIVAAAIRPDGRVGAEVVKDMRATDLHPLTAEQVIAAVHGFDGYVVGAAFDTSAAGAPAFRRDRDETGFPWLQLTTSGLVAACMDVAECVQSGILAVCDPLLDAQVALTGRRPVGTEGAFRFARNASSGPIDGHLAMVYAVHTARSNADIGIYIP
jgi:hypothetical protein